MSGPLASCEPYQLTIGGVSALTPYVILYYDYFLTLSTEVDGYWCAGSHSWASIVFLVNRYVALLGHVPLLYVLFRGPCMMKSIEPFIVTYHSILIWVLTSLTQALLVMRVYALYCRNKWILSVVMLEVVAGTLITCWSLARVVHRVDGEDSEPGTQRHDPYPVAMAFSGLLIVDLTIFVFTIARSIRLWAPREPFLHRLFIDGLLYYGVIWNLNLFNVIVLLVFKPNIRLSTPSITNILSVVMVSRLMINLRDPSLQRPASCDGTVTTSPAGYVSTVALEETIPSTPVSPSESNQ